MAQAVTQSKRDLAITRIFLSMSPRIGDAENVLRSGFGRTPASPTLRRHSRQADPSLLDREEKLCGRPNA
jgi:hypothetical protein